MQYYSKIRALLATKLQKPVIIRNNKLGKFKLSFIQKDINKNRNLAVKIIHVGDDHFVVGDLDAPADRNPVLFPVDSILKIKL